MRMKEEKKKTELEIEVSAFLFPYRPRATLSLPLLPSFPLSFATLASFPLLAFSQSKASPKAQALRLPPPLQDFFGGLSVPSNNFFKKAQAQIIIRGNGEFKCWFSCFWSTWIWFLLHRRRTGKVGDGVKHEERVITAPPEVKRTNI